MFQQEYPYELFDDFQNVDVLGFEMQDSISSSLAACSGSISEQQSYLLSSLQARRGSKEEPSMKRKRRRRRTRCEKSMEDKENQRMNHIAIERNRRKQMNHLLCILRYMMPVSYTQRDDQASIIEGTINYLKKQEKLLQSLEAKVKTTKLNQSSNIFSNFFLFPQYSTAAFSSSSSSSINHHNEPLTAVADVEVTMTERHANIKISTKTRPRLLFNVIREFNSLGLSTLHINFTTSKEMSLFTFNVKVEEDCQLTTTVDEVANAVHEVVRRLHKQN